MSMSFPLGRRGAASKHSGQAESPGRPENTFEALEERLSNRNLLVGGIAAFALLGVLMVSIALVAVARDVGTGGGASASGVSAEHAAAATVPPAGGLVPALAADDPAAEGIDFEPFERVDPTLPDVPEGDVKRFEIDVFEHVTQVSPDLAPTRVWSYGVNDELYRGTGASPPMVVEQGDEVEIVLRNGGSEEMDVRMPHSIDFHSSKVAPNVAFATISPGETHEFSFTAEHVGTFLYHCATAPVLHHTAAGMVGAMIVKPKDLKPVDRELWIAQQEFYIGEPGQDADYAKAQAKQPDVIAFNGYANQYMDHPIEVEKDETIRMFVLNAGPNIWSAFHVIGTVFDRTVVEGVTGKSAQTVDLNPNQGGYVEFTLDEEGVYPFVTHAFADMEKGALGALKTAHAEADGGGH